MLSGNRSIRSGPTVPGNETSLIIARAPETASDTLRDRTRDGNWMVGLVATP